jgi:predicted  nucleic acid-binding Zn-ribbon protein
LMSGRAETLYRLQLVDRQLEDKGAALRSAEERLDDDHELVAARRAVAEEEEKVRRSRSQLRESELDLEELSGKIASTEASLYGGEITNPKELASMQQELNYLRLRQEKVEEGTLAAMSALDDRERMLTAAEERVAAAEQSWDELQRELRAEIDGLRSQVAESEMERVEIATGLAQKDLSLYESLRRQRGGYAVALLENGICQGCRVALPTGMAQKVRRGSEIVQCGSCQRILHSAH